MKNSKRIEELEERTAELEKSVKNLADLIHKLAESDAELLSMILEHTTPEMMKVKREISSSKYKL